MDIPQNYLDILLRLLLALVIGGVIGIERQTTNHNAGLRTHILVCLGSAVVMIMSEQMVADFGGEISRIGAQVVSGIGFLGAGCIIVNGNKIKGLTTAAGLWATACVGLSIGLGYYFLSLSVAAFMIIAMWILHPLGNRLQKRSLTKNFEVELELRDKAHLRDITDISDALEQRITCVEVLDERRYIICLRGQRAVIDSMISELIEKKEIKNAEIRCKQDEN